VSPSLLQGVKAQDPEAWRLLAELYGPLVFSWCRARGLQPADAEDVLQEVFLTVAARVGDFRREREGDTFRGWLSVITRNKIGDWIRRQRDQETAVGGTDAHRLMQEEPVPEPADWPEPGEAGDLYQRAMELIRTEFADVTWQAFLGVVVEGRAPADVAADLGISRNAVYLARSRVLRRLREVLGEE
jgi:RNA polymerase sigma-70 factor (ECF subfamily)